MGAESRRRHPVLIRCRNSERESSSESLRAEYEINGNSFVLNALISNLRLAGIVVGARASQPYSKRLLLAEGGLPARAQIRLFRAADGSSRAA
jgi:hypothetical protein